MIHLRKYNESIEKFNYESVDFFDLVVEKVKKYQGWTVFSISKDENFCQIFNFESQSLFEKNFTLEKHPRYPGNMIIPLNVVEDYNRKTDICIVDGSEFSLEISELYLVVDGKLIR